MRFPLLSPGKYICITTFFPKDPKVFYKNIHTNHFPTGVQSLMRYRVAARREMIHSDLQIYSRREILAQGQRGKTLYLRIMPGTHKHPQRANKSVVSAYTHAEMSLSTLKGKGHFGQNLNMWSQRPGVTKQKEIRYPGRNSRTRTTFLKQQLTWGLCSGLFHPNICWC